MPRRGENIRKRKDGRWEGRYIKFYDSSGKSKYGSVYGKTYFEVKRKLSETMEQLLLNTLPNRDHEITFREVLFLWLQNNRIKIKEQSYAKYLYLVENHLLPVFGQTHVKRLKVSTINEFLHNKGLTGRIDGNGGLSPSYIQTLSFIIGSAIEYAVKENYCLAMNGDIIRPRKRQMKNEIQVLSVKEQLLLESYVFSEPSEKKLGIILSLYTGLRIGEVCGLNWADVDLESNTLHVRHTVERITNVEAKPGDTKTKLVLCDAKTYSSNRVIPIPSKILPIMKKYYKNTGFVMQGNMYEYTDPRTFQNNFHKLLEKCHVRSVNYHTLRHTFATRCIEAGVDIKSLSEILGHATVNITLNCQGHNRCRHNNKEFNEGLA